MDPQHVVVVVGAAVAGSEAASVLAEHGARCIVLEQNERPYGKIEDGLPRWHVNLRLQEEAKIDRKLDHPAIHYLPRARLSRDISLAELQSWGASAIIVAAGAWRDRPLPLAGIDQYVGRGFYYQNPFVYWFNHYPSPDYRGPQVELADGAIVVGGGLASLDVVKIVMLETVTRTCALHGRKVDLYDMERRGIPTVLDEHGLSLGALGVRGCTLVYRRAIEDMPVVEPPESATPEQYERTRGARRKLLKKFVEKNGFTIEANQVPVGYSTDGEHLTGLRLAATEVREGRVAALAGTERDVPTRLVVSSIGSVPEPIAGIEMKGEFYPVRDMQTGALEGLDGIFAIGNAVTGKGNIVASQRHGRRFSQWMLESYLAGTTSGHEETLASQAVSAGAQATAVAARLARRAPLAGAQVASILEKFEALRRKVNSSHTAHESS
jgi:NADPH-dependent glutamate synthase beta subunit-like oxidoreductase